MSCLRGIVVAGDVACGLEVGNCNETPLWAIVSTGTTFKDKSAKDFRSRDMMTSVSLWFFRRSRFRSFRATLSFEPGQIVRV